MSKRNTTRSETVEKGGVQAKSACAKHVSDAGDEGRDETHQKHNFYGRRPIGEDSLNGNILHGITICLKIPLICTRLWSTIYITQRKTRWRRMVRV